MPDADTMLQRAARGDRHAFDAFVVATSPGVWGLLRRLTVSEASAEEALQETYLAAWRGLDGFREETTARGWVYGIARHQAARTWRRRAGEPKVHDSLEALGAAAGWGADPERAAAKAEDRDQLFAALARLSAADQEVLTRCDLEGLSAPELGEEIGLSGNAVRVRLHRARLRLMAALREGGFDA